MTSRVRAALAMLAAILLAGAMVGLAVWLTPLGWFGAAIGLVSYFFVFIPLLAYTWHVAERRSPR